MPTKGRVKQVLTQIKRSATDRSGLLNSLARQVQYCDLCERMCHRTRVLSAANGEVYARVVFVAEAPGRLGADRTGVPLHGDRTGDNFETLLGNIGWNRADVFITNAVLCNPRDEKGNNAPPSRREIANCAVHLEMTLNLVNPDVVVALGAVAMDALSSISPLRVTLRDGVGKPLDWNGRLLVPMYHPGPRALIHRSMLQQRADYVALSKLVDPRTGLKGRRRRADVWNSGRNLSGEVGGTLEQTVLVILQSLGKLSYFKLHKLLYLIDVASLQMHGSVLTGATYLRMQEGPWLTTLDKVVASMVGHEAVTFFHSRRPYVQAGPSPRLSITLTDAQLDLIAETLERYGQKSDAAIKTAAYLTDPMRRLIRLEKAGRDTRREVVLAPHSTS